MNKEQRREKMVEIINREGSISFAKLKENFLQVSEMTLRRDLEFLDRNKRIIRTHGGARSVDVLVGTDDLYIKRNTRNTAEKIIIAEKAVQLLQENTTIFLDSGTTCTEFARLLPDGPYMIFTSSLSCALELCRLQRAQVHFIGGRVNTASLCVNGAMTMQNLSHINFQTAFLGVTGYISSRGFTCGAEEDCALKRLAISRAEKVVMLMDTQKVGLTSSFTFAGLEDTDVVVSDGLLPEKTRHEFMRSNIEVI